MDPLAAIPSQSLAPVATPAFPAEWIQSGAITPVITTPGATQATAWVPQPVAWSPPQQQPSLIDAITSAMLGTGQAAAPQTSPGDTGAAAPAPAALTIPAAVLTPVASPIAAFGAEPGSPAAMAASAAATGSAPAPVAATVAAPTAAPAPAGAPASDPTLVASVSGALAGFASATGKAVKAGAGVGISHAKRVGTELWAGVRSPRSVHITQVPSKFNPSPAAGNRDCGPVSVAVTLRLLGKAIPGIAASAAPQRLVNRVRELAGNTNNGSSTTNHELERALTAAGTTSREIADAGSIKRAVLAGRPVILNGNPRAAGAYGSHFSSAQMTPYNGAHWIVVSGYDSKAGTFIINDPLSKVGPVKVTPAQLEAYRGGSLGIEVTA
ncbi:MAG: hypothetical protein JWM98_345 [Thermoleophilia bacterium]|nr:hypothetical protein [Thermoleophilia bacterium]